MSALAITRGETPADGLMRSARLMRALGPDAAPIWAELSKSEVQALTAAMDTLGPSPEGETEAVSQFVEAHRRLRQPAQLSRRRRADHLRRDRRCAEQGRVRAALGRRALQAYGLDAAIRAVGAFA